MCRMKKASNKFTELGARSHIYLVTLLPRLEARYAKWSAQAGHLGKFQAFTGVIAGTVVANQGVAMAAGGTCGGKTGTSQVVTIIKNGTKFIIALIAVASVAMLAWASFLYITSGGSSGRASKAKDAAKNVLIGFGLAAAIYIVRSVVLDIVGQAGGGNNDISNCLKDSKIS